MKRRLDLPFVAGQFKLEVGEIVVALKELIQDGTQHGITDLDNRDFYHLTKEENQNLINLLSTQKIPIKEIAQEMEISPKAIKEWMDVLIQSRHLYGTFDPKGEVFTPFNLFASKVKESFEKSGKLGISEAAVALQLSNQEVRDSLQMLIDSRQLDGFFTLDNEYFITTKRLEEDLFDFMREEKRFPLNQLATKLNLQRDILKEYVESFIMTGKINGTITDANEFISDELLDQRLVAAIIPYSRVSIQELSGHLGLNEKGTKSLIARAISKGLVHGSIDSVSNEFVKERAVAAPTPVAPKEAELIDVKRDYDYIGGDIRFKVALQNITKTTVSKMSVLLNIPDQFQAVKNVEKVEILNPGETRGVDFMFTPLACGKGQIFGTVSYTDAYGEPHSVTIRPKEVWVKCPLVKSQEASLSEIDQWKLELTKSTTTIDGSGISKPEAFRTGCEQIAALDLAESDRDEIGMKATFSGIAKVTGDRLLVEVTMSQDTVVLDVYTSDQKQATGLLAYMKNLIKISMDVSRKLQVKAEKLGVKVLTAFQIARGLFNLCDFCETRAPVCDFILQVKELNFKILKEFPEIRFITESNTWLDALLPLDENEAIPDNYANSLEFDAIRWLREVEGLAENTAVIYLDSFDTRDEERDKKIGGGILRIQTEIEVKESNYSQRVARYLLLIHKVSGLCLFNHKFGPGKFDPDLMSGFLQAIQSFGSEISSSDDAGMRRLSYKDFEISLEEGAQVRVALVGVGKITNLLQDRLLDFVKLFSSQFQAELAEFRGNVAVFSPTTEIIKTIFGT